MPVKDGKQSEPFRALLVSKLELQSGPIDAMKRTKLGMQNHRAGIFLNLRNYFSRKLWVDFDKILCVGWFIDFIAAIKF